MRTGGARLGLIVLVLGLGVGLGLPGTPAAAVDSNLTVDATIGGASLKQAGANSPIELRPTDSTVIAVTVTNKGQNPVEIRSVRLDAKVLGLAFFSYTTRVDLTVAPGSSGSRTFALDIGDLDGQATGLLPAELALLSADRTVLASEEGTVDVKGKLRSVYGVFGIAVAAITALLLLGLIGRLFRRTLPDNRWSRAVRFAVPGIGIGLVATFTLGVLRIAVPSRGTSLGLLVGGLVVGFVLGYLTPSPSDEADRDELDEDDVVAAPTTLPSAPSWAPDPATAEAPAPAAAPVTAPPPQPIAPESDDPRQTRVAGPPAPPNQPPTA
jgi:hypothetical protein